MNYYFLICLTTVIAQILYATVSKGVMKGFVVGVCSSFDYCLGVMITQQSWFCAAIGSDFIIQYFVDIMKPFSFPAKENLRANQDMDLHNFVFVNILKAISFRMKGLSLRMN